tara:strand:- start:5458 stop:6255 length:798 start_codon:yes stop_codon:yes gene_type:complete
MDFKKLSIIHLNSRLSLREKLLIILVFSVLLLAEQEYSKYLDNQKVLKYHNSFKNNLKDLGNDYLNKAMDEVSYVFINRDSEESIRNDFLYGYFLKNSYANCDLETRTIYINNRFWERLNEIDRKILIYHELGHCVLERTHNHSFGENGKPNSIMSEFLIVDNDFVSKEEEYLKELFNQNIGSLNLLTEKMSMVSKNRSFDETLIALTIIEMELNNIKLTLREVNEFRLKYLYYKTKHIEKTNIELFKEMERANALPNSYFNLKY